MCPICKVRPKYRKRKIINKGYAIQKEDGSYYFKKEGKTEKIDKWWTCKPCTKLYSAIKYNNLLIHHFNKK